VSLFHPCSFWSCRAGSMCEGRWDSHYLYALAQTILEDCEESLLTKQVDAEELKLRHLQENMAREQLHADQMERVQKELWDKIEILQEQVADSEHCKSLLEDKNHQLKLEKLALQHDAVASAARVQADLVPLAESISEANSLLASATQSLVEDLGSYEASWLSSLQDLKANLRLEMAELRRKLGDAENKLQETAVGLDEAQQQVILCSCARLLVRDW
jgi:hypothetical protein